jgi:hypothetical protein
MTRKIKIPIVGIISMVLTWYFLQDPKLKIAEGRPLMYGPQPYAKFGDSIAMMFSVTVPVTNTSLKSGFVDRVEVIPNGIKLLPYTVKTVEMDRDWVSFKEVREVKFQVTITYSLHHSSFFSSDPNEQYYPALRFQLFDNKNHPVLEANENSTWFIVMASRRSTGK